MEKFPANRGKNLLDLAAKQLKWQRCRTRTYLLTQKMKLLKRGKRSDACLPGMWMPGWHF